MNAAKVKEVKVVKLDRQMSALRFSPDGKLLVAGGQDASIRRFDATTPELKPLAPLNDHHGFVSTLAFHPDGKRLLSGDSWGRLTCRSLVDGKPIWSIEQAHDGWLRSLAIGADGQSVATCGADGKVRLWSCADGKKQSELSGHGVEVHSVVLHPDGKSLVSGDCKAVVKQWDISTSKVVREFDAKSMYAVYGPQELGGARVMAFDAKGTTLAVGGATATAKGLAGTCIMLFDWTTGKATHTIRPGTAATEGYVQDLSFHPDGWLMAVTSGSPGQGSLVFVKPGDATPFLKQPLPNPQCLAVAPGFKRIVVSTTNAGSNGNGRNLDKNKEYPGNYSPLFVYDVV